VCNNFSVVIKYNVNQGKQNIVLIIQNSKQTTHFNHITDELTTYIHVEHVAFVIIYGEKRENKE